MIISESFTIGQITFILRVVVQILSYGGLALINLLILGNSPRVALIETHDVINRVVGTSTATESSAKWILARFRRNRKDPISSTHLLIALLFSLSYTAFVALSDIGYLGFYTCSVPGPTILDFPASVSSDDAALALISANMINGTDPSTIKAFRCTAVEPFQLDPKFLLNRCTAWHNSTYADKTWFNGINSTDSDVLMPRQLAQPKSSYPHPLNSYHLRPTTRRLTNPTIVRGLAIEPHETGLRVVIGVPQLTPQRKVELSKVMALEVDVGCMALGINSQRIPGDLGYANNSFSTTGNWRKYTGPDYLRDVLTNTTDITRQFFRPFFNESTLDSNGFIYGINQTLLGLSDAAYVGRFLLPNLNPVTTKYIAGNCTQNLQSQLGISPPKDGLGKMCTLLEMGGSFTLEGQRYQGLSRMVCASATQLNMVDATIVVDVENKMSLNLTRLPSDLNRLRADYWDTLNGEDSTIFDPYVRFTFADNPSSPTTHFITQEKAFLLDSSFGPGSGSTVFSQIGDLMLASSTLFGTDVQFAALSLLDEGFDDVDIANTSTARVTRWSGQIGGSFILESVGYNGWAARASPPIQVLSTGGKTGSCYKPYYAFGFAPLVFSATVVVIWAIVMLTRKSLSGAKSLGNAYGGLRPYVDVMCPGVSVKDTMLIWGKTPEPRLEVVSEGDLVLGSEGSSETALGYLKAE